MQSPMNNRDIAIIGMSCRFPEAPSLDALYENLKNGRDSVREISNDRIQNTIGEQREYQVAAFIEDVDKFDHKFFGISKGEAEMMDPHQRIILEVVYNTFENAGYNPADFRDSNTGVYNSCPELKYFHFIEEFDPTIVSGNLSSMVAGRIARYFNLIGPAVRVDTACSSSLVAVHQACNDLILGEVSTALVCAEKLMLHLPVKGDVVDIGTLAEDGKSKTFSAQANGIGAGEAFSCLLLKRLEKAKEDGDQIHAIIKATSVNQDADRSSFLTSPSSIAQTEVIKEAWRKATIDPRTISYIEVHGTGTKIGDPIEIDGINNAFKAYTSDKHFCAVSSIKTNIGHTDTAAGMSGLLKAILSLKYKQLFPSLHFTEPNPLIDFENSAIFVNDKLMDWHEDTGSIRRAGVSSFGLSGTNCHVVVEESVFEPSVATRPGIYYPFVFSSKTPEGLRSNVTAMLESLSNLGEDDLKNVSYTLTVGRELHAFRLGVIAHSVAELHSKLDEFLANFTSNTIRRINLDKAPKLRFLFSDSDEKALKLINKLSAIYPYFEQLRNMIAESVGNEQELNSSFIFQYCFYKLLQKKGLITKKFLSIGTGKTVVQVIMDKISLHQAVAQTPHDRNESVKGLTERLEKHLDNEDNLDSTVFVEMGSAGELGRIIASLSKKKDLDNTLINISDHGPDPLKELVLNLCLIGFPVDWKQYWEDDKGTRMELPGYQFEKIRCWVTTPITTVRPETKQQVSHPEAELDAPTSIEEVLYAIWESILKPENLSSESDFFEIGGNSLNGVRVLNQIEKRLHVSMDFEDLLDYPTICELTAHIEQLKFSQRGTQDSPLVAIEEQAYYEVSRNQRDLWMLDHLKGRGTVLNMPAAYIIAGPIDLDAFELAFKYVIERHESLRTVFISVAGAPKQKILPASEITFRIDRQERLGVNAQNEELHNYIKQEAFRVFDLKQDLLIRAKAIKLEKNKLVFVLTLHHIISDAWSMEIIINEVMNNYRLLIKKQSIAADPLSIQYKDYTAWQIEQLSGERLKLHREYWINQLSQSPVLEFPYDYKRPEKKTYNGAVERILFDSSISEKLEVLSREKGATLFNTLMTSINLLLFKYTGQTDIVVGTPIAGREHADLEGQIGLFINTMVNRTQFSTNTTFSELLGNVKERMLNNFNHKVYPIDLLVEDLHADKDKSRNPLFDVVVVLQNAKKSLGVSTPIFDNIKFEGYGIDIVTSQVDLHFAFHEAGEGLFLLLTYNTDLFERSSISLLCERFKDLLAQISSNPNKVLTDYNITHLMSQYSENPIPGIAFNEDLF
jgi:3-oxoacyl-(acyl-carrier-protein) synthase/acyl carrier protein